MNLRLLTTIGVTMLLSCSGENAQPPDLSLRCEIALDYAKDFTRRSRESETSRERRIAIQASSKDSVREREELEAFLEDQPQLINDPDHPLILDSIEVGNLNVLDQCGELRAWAAREDALTDEQEIGRLVRRSEDWPIDLLTMSMPALSDDRAKALLYVSEHSGALAGWSLAVTYEKDSEGHWFISDSNVVSVS